MIQPIQATLSPHMIQALALLEQWITLEHVQREQPLQKIDFTTLVQCFHKIGLNRIPDILLKNDAEYIEKHLFSVEAKVIAKDFILSGGLYPKSHNDICKRY